MSMAQPLSNASSTWILTDAEGNADGNTEPLLDPCRHDTQGGNEPGPLDPSSSAPQGGEQPQQSEACSPDKGRPEPSSQSEPPSRFRRVANKFGSIFASKIITISRADDAD